MSEPPYPGESESSADGTPGEDALPLGVAGEGQLGSSRPRTVRGEDIPVVELRQNVDQVVVRTTHDKLQAHLESFQRGLKRSFDQRIRLTEAAAYAGIGVTLLLPLFTADFRNWGPISPAILQAGCGISGSFMLILAARKLVHAGLARRKPSEDHEGVTAAVEAIESDPDPPASS